MRDTFDVHETRFSSTAVDEQWWTVCSCKFYFINGSVFLAERDNLTSHETIREDERTHVSGRMQCIWGWKERLDRSWKLGLTDGYFATLLDPAVKSVILRMKRDDSNSRSAKLGLTDGHFANLVGSCGKLPDSCRAPLSHDAPLVRRLDWCNCSASYIGKKRELL